MLALRRHGREDVRLDDDDVVVPRAPADRVAVGSGRTCGERVVPAWRLSHLRARRVPRGDGRPAPFATVSLRSVCPVPDEVSDGPVRA